ncbi:MAG: AgmX/PglI C-terminal domain-containing protein, partial [Bdellovibrionota bacterium]
QGGTGKALEGIAGGVGTKGRGSGVSGTGMGGLGNKAGTRIVTGGSEESYSGTIDREAIRRVILANLRTIKTCYNRQLERNPDLLGKLVLSWDIGEGGRVLATRVKSNELGNRAVAECIMDNLRQWKFPEPPSNQVVVVEAYPFVFSN